MSIVLFFGAFAIGQHTYLFAKIGGSWQWFAIFSQRWSPIRWETMRLWQMALHIWRWHNWWWHRCRQCGRWSRCNQTIRTTICYTQKLLWMTIHNCIAKHACWRLFARICICIGRCHQCGSAFFFNQCIRIECGRFRSAVTLMRLLLLLLLLLWLLLWPLSILAILFGFAARPIRFSFFVANFGVSNWEPTKQLRTQIFTKLPTIGSIANQCYTIMLMECQLILARCQIREQRTSHRTLVVFWS